MRKPVTATLLLIPLLGSAVLGATAFHEPIASAAGELLNVFVTNDRTHPVPVSETNTDANGNIKVHDQGTASVNVANPSLPVNGTVNVGNLPSTQQVTGTVGINPAANGVQDINSVALRPFSHGGTATFGSGNPGAFGAEVDLFTVPTGERVVITYARVAVNIPSGEHAVASMGSSLFGAQAELPLVDAGAFNVAPPANEFLTGGGPVTAVFSPGEHITVEAFRSRNDGDNIGELDGSVTGYTVPTQ